MYIDFKNAWEEVLGNFPSKDEGVIKSLYVLTENELYTKSGKVVYNSPHEVIDGLLSFVDHYSMDGLNGILAEVLRKNLFMAVLEEIKIATNSLEDPRFVEYGEINMREHMKHAILLLEMLSYLERE